jgi:Predicted drug exporters of the RND superfamily
MGKFKQNYWLSLLTWLVIGIISLLALPNISQVVAEHGQTQIPSSAKSEVAKTIQQDWGHHLKNTRQIVVVFNNGDQQLSGQQQKKITQTIHKLKADKDKYGIKKFTAAADNSATQKQLVSKDKSTQLLQLDVSKKKSVRESSQDLKKAAATTGVKTYVTGADVLNDDFSRATEEGIKKTEIIAVILFYWS